MENYNYLISLGFGHEEILNGIEDWEILERESELGMREWEIDEDQHRLDEAIFEWECGGYPD